MRLSNANDIGTKMTRRLRGALVMMALTTIVLTGSAAAQATVTPSKEPQTTAASQTTPESTIQLGAGGVSAGSYKFGEYNGLQNSGPFGIANFDLRGGAAYDSKSTWRWRLQGSNLGLESRRVTADFGKQGKFSVRLLYDEIRANRSDTFQTPYLGAGTNNLTLPANWIKPRVTQVNANNLNFRSLDPVAGAGSFYNTSGVLTAPTPAQLATLNSILAADVPDFLPFNFFTKRTRGEAAVTYSPTEEWDMMASYDREHKGGTRQLGAVTSQVSENAIIMPYVVDWNTDEANVGVSYKLKRLFLNFAYYGSNYHNNVTSMTWQDTADPTKTATLGEEPSNQFNQFKATAAYKISQNMKLVASGSYGRNTQNQAFVDPTTAQNGQLAFGLPTTSLNGLVVSSQFMAKLTAKKGAKWNFSADYKFDNRDNQTPVNTYLFQDANESKSGVSPFAGLQGLPATVGSNTNIYQNRAYSRELNQFNAEAEYAIVKGQYLQGDYDWQRTARSCDGSWINCADAPVVNENTLRAEWRKGTGTFTARLGYAFSMRRGQYDENAFLALVPMANVVPAGGATLSLLGYLQSTGLTAFGPLAGLPTTPLTGNALIFSPLNNIVPQALYGSRNNINEIPGMRRYYVADRNRNKARAQFDWQATQKFSIQGTGEYTDDNYLNSTYGVTRGTFLSATFDASYALTADFVTDLFYTYDNQLYSSVGDAYGSNSTTAFVGQAADTLISGGCFPTIVARNAAAKMDPCLNWYKNDRDKIDTFGFNMSRKNLAKGKLELVGEFLYTRARTATGVAGGSYVNNPLALAAPAPALPAGTAAAFFILASDYPLIRNDEVSVRSSATYNFSKKTSLQGYYWFQRLMSEDWAYLGNQFGTGTTFLPTLEKAPSYGVHVAGVTFTYTY